MNHSAAGGSWDTEGVFLETSESSEFCEKQASESSTTRNQKNKNTENNRARNKGYFHWMKTRDDDIFVVRYSNHSRPLEAYLQNLRSLRSLQNLQLLR